MDAETERVDVVVVGGGPAGLATATELRRLGVGRVVVVEREAAAGGIPRHCGHPPFGMREFGRVLTGPTYAARLVARAEAAGVDIRRGATVTALHPGGSLSVTTSDGPTAIAARAVVLATGVRESSRAQRLIGGEKPGGILPTGALQGLVHLEGRTPFRRPVIIGTELVAFSALLTCRHAGIQPVAMVEAGPRPIARTPSLLLARALRVPVFTETTVEAIVGRERVEAVVVVGPAGRRTLDADGVIVSGAFRPEATLLAATHLERDPATGGPVVDVYGRLSDPAYFAAGNILRPVETAGWCWSEGRRTATAVAEALAGRLPDRAGGVRVRLVGPALKFAVPQVLMRGPAGPGAMRDLQVRLARPAAGRLTLADASGLLAERAVDSLPERRILLALPPLPGTAGAGLRLRLGED